MPVLSLLSMVDPSLLLGVLLFFLPLFVIRKLRAPKHTEFPPRPRGIPIAGNLHQLGSLPHRSLRSLSDKHGPVMLLYLGKIPTLVISSADAAREMMKTHDLIFSSRPPFKVAQTLFYGGADMAFAPYGEFWRNVRKVLVTHLLSTKMVQTFQRIREGEVAIMMDRISSQASSVIDMREVLVTFVNDFLCRVVSGRLSGDRGRKEMIRELAEDVSALMGAFVVGDYIPCLGWIDGLLGLTARVKRSSNRWDDVLDEVIEAKVNQERREGVDDVDDFVDVLLTLQKDPNIEFELTNNNIKALLVDILAAGTDPANVVLEWAMVELIRYPEVMKKLQHELREKASGKSIIREEDLVQMGYLKAVLKEVFRLHPPAPLLIPRELMEDCLIQGYRIPNKSRVIVNAWAISRDPNIWEAPEEFQPERFVGSPIDFKGNDFQFIPFGAGRRICPGMSFSIAIIELALANLVSQFEWELPEGMTIGNMDEAPGLVTRRTQKLELVAKRKIVKCATESENIFKGSAYKDA